MKWTCDCGAEIEFPDPEMEGGFIVSKQVCPNCGQVWTARVMKSNKIALKDY